MEQAQRSPSGSVSVDKRTKEYKQTIGNSDAYPQKVQVGSVQFHGTLFFAKKNFKEKLDVRSDKGPDGTPITLEYDRTEKELAIRCGKHKGFIPYSNIVIYYPIESIENIPQVQPTTGASAVPGMNAQVSGPHDHVFAGLGNGQTGMGAKVK